MASRPGAGIALANPLLRELLELARIGTKPEIRDLSELNEAGSPSPADPGFLERWGRDQTVLLKRGFSD